MERPWHDDDAFWTAMQDFLFDQTRLAAASAQIEWILQTLELPPGARILDLPCGTGRHAIEFSRRGMDVTGVDRMRTYLDAGRDAERRARESEPAASWGAPISWCQADMRSYATSPELHHHFDAAVNLWTSLGYFDSWDENQGVLSAFASALRPGGGLIIELAGREAVAMRFQKRRWSDLPDGRLLLEDVAVIDDWSRMKTRWTVIGRDGSRVGRTMTLWLYSASDMRAMLTAAGFTDIRFFGSFAGDPYDHTAKRLIVAARTGDPGAAP